MIQIKNLNKIHYNRGENQVKALTNINIDFDEKGITFIAGASGNGKSTLLSLIGGIDKYEDGQILVDGTDLKTLNARQMDAYRNSYVDFIIQENALIPSLTVAENVRLEKAIHGQYASDEEVNEALEIVGLSGFGDRMPAEISGGEKKRVAVARTLLMNVKVILVDEPTASLDKKNSDIIWDVLKKYSENHLIIAVTHNEEAVQKYGDRVITLEKGEIVDDKRLTKKKKAEPKPETKLTLNHDLEKSRLGAKQTVKLAYSYITSKKVSFTFVTLLSCLALLFFSVFFILDGYNYNKVLANAVQEEDTPYVAFLHGSSDSSLPINDALNDEIYNDFRKANLPVMSSFKDMSKVNFAVDFGPGFYSSNAQNFTIKGLISDLSDVADQNKLGQKVLSGSYPTSDNEVVISDYFAALLKKYGAYYNGSAEVSYFEGTVDDEYAGLIGKEISTNYGYVKVCGVYETDYRRFVDESLAFRGYNAEEFDFKLNYIYSTLHTTSGFISNYAETHTQVDGLVATIEKDNINLINTTSLKATIIENFAGTIYLDTEYAATINDVTSTDIVVSTRLYNELIEGIAGYTALGTMSGSTVDFGIDEYTYPGISLDVVITLNNCEPVTYRVVGVFEAAAEDNNVEILFTKTRYVKDILAQTTFSTNTKVLFTSVGNDYIEEVINILENKGFSFVSINSNEITNYGERIAVMKSAFLIASIFMAVYSLVLMYYFISQMIADKKNDIGVLKTLGCGKGDIAGIFVLCSASIALLVFLITVLFTFVVAAISNLVVVSQIPVTISVFGTSGLMYLWIALICLAVVTFGTFLPIRKYSKMPPKELMKIF